MSLIPDLVPPDSHFLLGSLSSLPPPRPQDDDQQVITHKIGSFIFSKVPFRDYIKLHSFKTAYYASLEADFAGSLALDPAPPVGRRLQRCRQRERVVVALVVVHGVEPAGQEALPHGAPHPQPGPRLAPRGQGGEE